MAEKSEIVDDYYIVEPNEGEPGDILVAMADESASLEALPDSAVDVCYSIKVVKVCVESISNERIVLNVSVAGVRVARATLTPKNACVKIKGKVAGDGAKVEAKICADFAGRRLTIEGKICLLWYCTKFKQTILKW